MRLAEIDLREVLASEYEQATSLQLRRQFAAAYRSAVGVYPEQRHEFRVTLESLRVTGGTAVDDIASLMRMQFEIDQFLDSDQSMSLGAESCASRGTTSVFAAED